MAIVCGTETYAVQSRTIALERTLLEPVTFAMLVFITEVTQQKMINDKPAKHFYVKDSFMNIHTQKQITKNDINRQIRSSARQSSKGLPWTHRGPVFLHQKYHKKNRSAAA